MIEFSYPTGRTALRTANPGPVLDRNEGLLEVAQEAAHVADDEHVEGARLRRRHHRFPRRSAPCRGPAGGSNGPLEGAVRETVPGDGAVLLFALGIRAESVPLSGGRLAEPARRPHSADLVERLG